MIMFTFIIMFTFCVNNESFLSIQTLFVYTGCGEGRQFFSMAVSHSTDNLGA